MLFSSDSLRRWRKGCSFILAFFWISGLLCGILFCRSAGDSLRFWMLSAPGCTVSIFSLLLTTTLPFLFSAAAVSISRPVLLLPICFCEAFLLSTVSYGACQVYCNAGWLIRCLLLFSDCLCAPLLYLFWMRFLPGIRKFDFWEFLAVLSLVILIGSFDYRVISPLLLRLIEI